MPALNFKKQFVPMIESGKKKQTIRAWRKNPIKKGDVLYLYTGMRQKSCRKIGEAVCVDVATIIIGYDVIYLNHNLLQEIDMLKIAKDDGFKNYNEMQEWFINTYRMLPFSGQLIKWENVKNDIGEK